MKKTKPSKPDPVASTIAFDYIKSNSFHSIQADGAIGAITPSNHIHMAFFNERSAIPRRVVYELSEDGTLGKVRNTETRNSIVREMNVDVFMTLDSAKSIYSWLGETIAELEKYGNAK